VCDFTGISNKEEITNNWLVIGTNNKLIQNKSSIKKRVLTGEKGLGRLGLDRLSKKTIMRSFSEKEDVGTEIIINWEMYEKLDDVLESIKHKMYKIPKEFVDPITNEPRIVKKGSHLLMYQLRENWNKSYVKQLQNELTLLISPFAGINDFAIKIDSGNNWEDVDGVINSHYMLEAAEWKLVAEVMPDNNVHYVMNSKIFKKTFELPNVSWSERFIEYEAEKPPFGPLRFEMYFFPRREVKVNELTYSRKQIDDFMELNQGVRIYRDNFRVKPYGEPDGSGDWLNLSFRRQQSPAAVTGTIGAYRVGSNQVIGAVFISRENNPELIDQTNREGIVEGNAFFQLKKFVIDAVRFFELNRQEFEYELEKTNGKTSFEIAREKVQNATDESAEKINRIQVIVDGILNDKSLNETKVNELAKATADLAFHAEEAQKQQREFETIVEEEKMDLKEQKDTLGNLASLGILAHSFGHETLAASNLVIENTHFIKADIESGAFMVPPDVRIKVENSIEILLHESTKIDNFAKFTIGNVRRDNRNRTNIFINEIIVEVFGYFESMTSLQKRLDRISPNYTLCKRP